MQTKKRTTLVAALLLTMIGSAMALEEPHYDVVAQTPDYELRRYPSYLVAEVDVEGDLNSAGNRAFKILAGFIFGNNQGSTKMAMTAPVTARQIDEKKADQSGDVTIATQVTSRPRATDERYTYSFVMERSYTLQSLPAPNDPRVRIRQTEPRLMAVKRYSGRWNERNDQGHADALITAVETAGLGRIGEPEMARYNPPFMPWFMRRNEVMVQVAPSD